MDTKLKANGRGYYEIRYAEKTGTGQWVTRRVSCRTKSRTAAEAFRRAWLKEVLTGSLPAHTGGLLVSDLVSLYRDGHRGAGCQDWSLRPAEAYFGAVEPEGITVDALRDYEAERRGAGVASATVRRELGALRAALNWCAKHGKLERGRVPVFVMPPEGTPKESFLDEDQENEFYSLAMGLSMGKTRLDDLTLFVGLALDTAARAGAIEGLTWDRVDLKRGLIDFRDPLIPVSRKRRVVVPVGARLAPLLERAKRERTGNTVLEVPGAVAKRFMDWRKDTPTPWVTRHDLRRTWATLAARAGVDLWQIAGVLGDDIKTVMKHYAKHQPGYLRGAVDARFRS